MTRDHSSQTSSWHEGKLKRPLQLLERSKVKFRNLNFLYRYSILQEKKSNLRWDGYRGAELQS